MTTNKKSAQAWQPIETANKSCDPAGDTELILGFVPHSCGGYICVLYWNYLTEEWQNNIDGGTDRPSHWIPLPEPPAMQGGQV